MSPVESSCDLALIGTGYWGKNLARNFLRLGVLRSLCDPRGDALAAYGQEYDQVQKGSAFEKVLADPGIHKVAIAAPAALHFRLAKEALEADKDVFVEKPICLDLAEAAELVLLAEERQRVLMVGHLLQYHPCVQRLQELVVQGALGQLYYVTSNRLNLGKIRKEENALWSFAPHDISVILSLAGDRLPETVRCSGEGFLTRGVCDTTLTTMRFRDGLRAHIYVSWLNPFKEQKLTVVGSDGMVVFDDTKPWSEKLTLFRQYLLWADGRDPVPSRSPGEWVQVNEGEPLHAECRHFLQRCQDRLPPRTNGAEGMRVLQVLHAAQQSLESDGEAFAAESPQPVPEPGYYAHPTAVIDPGATIGPGTKIWHFTHVSGQACVGEQCVLGQNTFLASGVRLGKGVKVQNNVAVYSGSIIEDHVFLGPSCVLTNVTNPRAEINRQALYEKTIISRGATVGANATIVSGVKLGRYCFIAAGAVITEDVPDYALMVGVPARKVGWMSRHGHRLKPDGEGRMRCPESGLEYALTPQESLRCLDLDEAAPLPEHLRTGHEPYSVFKKRLP